jgi:transcriptional regulator with XRE-family HTH domain
MLQDEYASESPGADGGSAAPESAPSPQREAIARLGRRIRTAREGRYSVKQLATVSSVSAGLISEIERGMGNPSFKTLHSLALALGLQIGDLIESDPGASKAGLVRKSDRKRLAVGMHGPVWELLTPDLQGQLEVLETTLPDGFSNESSPFRHAGEECVVIQRGVLEIHIGDDAYLLGEGDSVTYDAAVPHWYRNTSGAPAVVLGAVTPPSF